MHFVKRKYPQQYMPLILQSRGQIKPPIRRPCPIFSYACVAA